MKRHIPLFLLTAALAALLVAPAYCAAPQYSFDGADDYLFGRPTSDDTIYEWENPNVDRSKNTTLIPPGFGTPTSSAQAAYLSLPAIAESSLIPLRLLSPQSLEGGFAGPHGTPRGMAIPPPAPAWTAPAIQRWVTAAPQAGRLWHLPRSPAPCTTPTGAWVLLKSPLSA